MIELCEELRKAREVAQLFKEVAEAEKQAAYTLRVQETQGRLTEEFFTVARDYCDISWGKALDVAWVLADSSLRRSESIYYDPEIRELSDPNSSLPKQTAPVSELPKEAETLQSKDKGKDKKDSSKPAEKALDTAISQLEQDTDLGAPKAKA